MTALQKYKQSETNIRAYQEKEKRHLQLYTLKAADRRMYHSANGN